MPFIRKKTIEMDGVSVTIAPLLSIEVDEFLAEQQKTLSSNGDGEEVKKFESLRKSWLDVIARGLNRGAGNNAAEFTVESIQKDFDKVFLERIRTEIMDMSGIGVAGEVKPPSISPS
jgi:hypothetical protein